MRFHHLALVLSTYGSIAVGTSPAAQEQRGMAADFSRITTSAAAKRAQARGDLVKVAVFPVELGGQDVAENHADIPPSAMPARQWIIAALADGIRAGRLDRMDAEPSCRGDSVVPSTILFRASHGTRGTTFEQILTIW